MIRPGTAGLAATAIVVAYLLMSMGCVRRTITITSKPPGALVWLNDREVGRTPVDVDFTHYGTFHVRLVHEDYEPMVTTGSARPPWWDNVGPDLVAEIIPAEIHARIEWHYDLLPLDDASEALMERAQQFRAKAIQEPELGPE
jgi:hypothetical protein